MTPATAAIVPALEEIAEAVGIRHTSGGARAISRAICDRVDGLDGLIVIDEAQHLKTASIEQIRSMHDATGVGVALVGNESVYARITGGGRTAAFAQISSRIGMRVYLNKPELEDVRRLAKARWNVTDAAVVDVLERVSSQPGGLRLVTKVMRSVTANKRKEVTADRVRAAADNLGMSV
jgi:DNA transposition AAA+ family ATPase